ncbi:hypothetical protein D3C76_1539210 [compost metagenome]
MGGRRTAKPDRGGDEALHQVALRRPDVRFEHLHTGAAQGAVQAHQLGVLLAIQPQHRTMLEIQQVQGA